MEITLEKSTEQAEIIKVICINICLLDKEYLLEVFRQMNENHSLKHAGSILAPNPHTIFQQLELEKEKLNQLNLLLDLRESQDKIQELKTEFEKAKSNSNKLEDFFR